MAVKVNPGTLTVEVTNPILQGFDRFLDYMPNPDLLLQDTGEQIEIYEKMLLDAKISSSLELRKIQVLKFPSHIMPADQSPKAVEVAAFADSILKKFNFYEESKELLSAFDFGFSFAEIVWKDPKFNNGLWIPGSIKNRKQKRIRFKGDGTPVEITSVGNRPLTDPFKFIIHRHNPGAENPYGNSLLKACYWPWMFKKAGFRFWLTAADKFGVPTVLAIFDIDETDENLIRQRAQTLAQALLNIQSDSAAALANVREVKVLEAKGLEEFAVLIEVCDAQISYAITGQSLATTEARFGTRAQSEVHQDVLKDMAKGDAQSVAYTLNTDLIEPIMILNYGTDAPMPKLVFETDDYASWEIIRDAMDRGLAVSQSMLYSKYNIPKPNDEKDTFLIPTPPTGAVNLSDNGFFFFHPNTSQTRMLRLLQRSRQMPSS